MPFAVKTDQASTSADGCREKYHALCASIDSLREQADAAGFDQIANALELALMVTKQQAHRFTRVA